MTRKTTLTIIKVDGSVVTHKEYDNAVPNYKVLQDAVGGYIEIVPYFNKYNGQFAVAFCNEDGKNNGLHLNVHAQELWEYNLKRSIDDYLVGDIAIVWGDESVIRTCL